MQTSLICISAVILSVYQILGFIFIIFYESRYFLTTAITLHKYHTNILRYRKFSRKYNKDRTPRSHEFASVARLNNIRGWSSPADRNFHVCSIAFCSKAFINELWTLEIWMCLSNVDNQIFYIKKMLWRAFLRLYKPLRQPLPRYII